MKEKTEFVERTLTIEQQQKLAKENGWEDDKELLKDEKIFINGRYFTIKHEKDMKGFKYSNPISIAEDILIVQPGKPLPENSGFIDVCEYFDAAYYLDENEKFRYFVGEEKNFIYEIRKSKLKGFKIDLTILNNHPGYSEDLTDEEMDLHL